jgi:hypothetical protein
MIIETAGLSDLARPGHRRHSMIMKTFQSYSLRTLQDQGRGAKTGADRVPTVPGVTGLPRTGADSAGRLAR